MVLRRSEGLHAAISLIVLIAITLAQRWSLASDLDGEIVANGSSVHGDCFSNRLLMTLERLAMRVTCTRCRLRTYCYLS